jgi:hypothetical protein
VLVDALQDKEPGSELAGNSCFSAASRRNFLPDGPGLRLTYVQGELSIEIQHSDYFVRLIQDHLVDENTVVQGILDLMRGIDPQHLRQGMTIGFLPLRGD